MRSEARKTMRWTVALFCIAAFAVFVPMWAPLVLAGWFAALTEPLLGRMKFVGGRHRAAAALTVLMFLVVVVPLGLVTLSMIGGLSDLIHSVKQSKGAIGALQSLIDGQQNASQARHLDAQSAVSMARSYGEKAWGVLTMIAGMATEAIIGVFVFGVGAYVMLAHATKVREWFYDYAPLPRHYVGRFGAAFAETGRGMLVGVVLTAAVQAAVATIAYFALGIPRALVLGLLTFFAGLIPTIGTALIWVPIAIGLAISGRTAAAIILAVVGVVVISSIDNLARPALARWGALKLPMFVVMVAMFGGLALLGAWGLVLGPLLVRLAVEALDIAREEKLFRPSAGTPVGGGGPPPRSSGERDRHSFA